MQAYCATCLSQDRRLTSLKSIQFQDFSLNSLNIDFLPVDSLLCWECAASVRRYGQFRRRALQARDVMEYFAHTRSSQLSEPIKSLSTLSIHIQKCIIHIVRPLANVKPEENLDYESLLEKPPETPGPFPVKNEFSDQEMPPEPLIENDLTDTETVFVEIPKIDFRVELDTRYGINKRKSTQFHKTSERNNSNLDKTKRAKRMMKNERTNSNLERTTRQNRRKRLDNFINVSKRNLRNSKQIINDIEMNETVVTKECSDSESSSDNIPLSQQISNIKSQNDLQNKLIEINVNHTEGTRMKLYTLNHTQKELKKIKAKKKVHFKLPSTAKTDSISDNSDAEPTETSVNSDTEPTEAKTDNSDTESAYTESDIEMDLTCKNKYSSNNKYNRDKFEMRKISVDRMERNRELERRSREYNKKFKCDTCIKGFDKKLDYAAHMDRFHSKLAGKLKCPVCSIRFSKQTRMKPHYSRHLQSYNCRKCHFFHYNIKAMYAHDKRRHSESSEHTFICRHCAQEFPTPATLSYHVKRTHSGQKWNSVTDRQPKKTYFIRKHERDPDKLPTCRVCLKTFLNKSYLRKHERSHAQPPPRQERECPRCGLKVRFLEAHIKKVHERNENAYCAECDIQFSSVFSYRYSHLKYSRRHHPEPDVSKRTMPCPYCDKKWSHQRDLDRHVILIHTKEYPFICDLCGKGFYFERRLKNHVTEKHEGIPKPKDKICTYCGKAFVHLQVLKQHIRTHTGEKPYECAHCPWKFSQRTSLVTHMKGKHPEHFGHTVIRKKKSIGNSVTTAP